MKRFPDQSGLDDRRKGEEQQIDKSRCSPLDLIEVSGIRASFHPLNSARLEYVEGDYSAPALVANPPPPDWSLRGGSARRQWQRGRSSRRR